MSRRRPPPGGTLLGAGLHWQWHELVQIVKRRDGYRCQACGRSDLPLEVDHVIPRIAGGTDELGNLRTLCRPCHKRRIAGADLTQIAPPKRAGTIFSGRPRPRVW